MGQVTVYSGPVRRRRWSEEERLRILNEAFSPGACVSDVARRHDVATSLIYTWRRKLCEANNRLAADPAPEAGFAEAVMIDDEPAVRSGVAPAMIIDLARGRRISAVQS